MSDLIKKLAAFLGPAIQAEGFEFVHLELVTSSKPIILRILIDSEQGLTHEHCSRLSRKIGEELDQLNFVPQAYTLEMSSPGIERGLYKLSDYQRFVGSKIKLRAITPINGSSNFKGTIREVRQLDGAGPNDETFFVILSLCKKGELEEEIVEIPFSEIKKANLDIRLEDLLRIAEKKHNNKE